MSPRTNDPERVSMSQSMHTSMVQGISNLASRSIQDDELSSHDSSSMCSSIPTSHGNPQDMKDWTLNHPDQPIKQDSSEVHMLSFSLSQQLMTPTVGPNDVMYSGVDFPAVPDMNDHEMSRDLYTSFLDFSSVENDVCHRNGTPDDALSIGHSSHTEDGHYITGPESWTPMMHDGQYPGTTMDQFSSGLFQTVPVSPPLTDASNDVSVTSSCSNSGFPSFMAPDDSLLGDFTTSPLGTHGINPAEPLFPNTLDRDLHRTIRPTRQSRRSALPAAQPKVEPEFFQPLPVREQVRQRSKEGVEARNPREHHYYSMSTHSDGKYYCPFATGEKPCSHPPTTQKCAYQQVLPKYLDSHLKPYRCKAPACIDAQLRFSSNACLFRHEREAHGLHGHGDNPHLCLWEGCERAVPGNGFPRRWNLYDHMRRVHDYATSERHSSPETSPGAGQIKKKEPASRKRRVTGATPAPTMKRTRSVHSQAGSVKATQASASLGQRLQTAERNYDKCRVRLLEELTNITPQDTSMHERVNAGLQELFTLGLNYRHIEASQAVSQMPSGLPA
ncbi:hypothetical protein N7467_007004 [Penicillium canescens]|nr:hypothetical protein N7467_007004 [Penicillium canescens]